MKTNNLNVAVLEQLIKIENSHAQGFKSVFLTNEDTSSALTQFAYGYMSHGDESGLHVHKTMDEYFFFIKGNAEFQIGGITVPVKPSTFIRVPAGEPHNLINNHNNQLEFVYFGIAV